jgi:mono/diheme cytochrome c family protein
MRTAINSTILSVAVAVALSSYSFVALSTVGVQDKQTLKAPTVSTEQIARAKTLFKERCSRCHGRDGDGGTTIGAMLDVPDFTDPKWWAKEPADARLIYSVTNGKNEMPAFGRKITKREIESLIAYVRLFNKEADTKSSPKQPGATAESQWSRPRSVPPD